ncbi:T9SS type A sorting domain-containing protein [Candidatus Neomarinimicrobiota bacterium]
MSRLVKICLAMILLSGFVTSQENLFIINGSDNAATSSHVSVTANGDNKAQLCADEILISGQATISTWGPEATCGILIGTLVYVEIDIMPGDESNLINCTKETGVLPVAILSTSSFNATTIDHTTVRIGKGGTWAAEKHINKKTGIPKRHVEDVDEDGDMDLVFHFKYGETGITCEDTDACLRGETYSGTVITGCSPISIEIKTSTKLIVDTEETKDVDMTETAESMDILKLPEKYSLGSNYPNPFNPITTIKYQLPENSYVTLTIYDIMGREIRQLINQSQQAGFKSIIWDSKDQYGKSVSGGVYIYHLQAGSFSKSMKMILLK